MKPKDALQYHLALLLETHGEKSVISALSHLLKLDENGLRNLMADVEYKPKARMRKQQLGRVNEKKNASLEAMLASYPEKTLSIKALKERFDNKTFLRELKDVKRFLDRHGKSVAAVKSRVNAFGAVADVLVHLSVDDLDSLLEMSNDNEYSSLGIISDQILGRT